MPTTDPPVMVLASEAVRHRRFGVARRLGAVSVALLALSLAAAALLAALPAQDDPLEGGAAVITSSALGAAALGIGAALTGLWIWLAALLAPRSRGSLEVGERGLTVRRGDRALHLTHEDIVGGWVSRADELCLRTQRGDVVTAATTAAEALELLVAIAKGPSERVLSVPVHRPDAVSRALWALTLLPIAGIVLAIAQLLQSAGIMVGVSAALAGAWVYFLLGAGAPRRAVLGRDGVALEGRTQRFIPYEQVISVAESPAGIELELDDTRTLHVPIVPPSDRGAARLGAMRRDGMVARIRAELAARARGGEPFGAALLDRGDRSLEAWRTAVRDLAVRPPGGYRAASLETEHIAAVLETEGAAPSLRLGAALALSAVVNLDTRRRVRVVIDTCVDDELRAAMEEASRGELHEPALKRATRKG